MYPGWDLVQMALYPIIFHLQGYLTLIMIKKKKSDTERSSRRHNTYCKGSLAGTLE